MIWGVYKCWYCCDRVTDTQMKEHPERYPGEWFREPLVYEDVHITPQVATEWLSWVCSREGRDTIVTVDSHAAALRTGTWEHRTLSHPLGKNSKILFSPYGYIVMGIQRIEAVVRAHRPMDAVVARPYGDDDPAVYRVFPMGTGEPHLPKMEVVMDVEMAAFERRGDDDTAEDDPVYVSVYQAVMEAIAPSYAVGEAVTFPTYKWLHKQAERRAKWLAGKYMNEAQTREHARD